MNSMGPAGDAVPYTSFATAIDLYAAHGDKVQALRIAAATTGASVVITTNLSGATTRTIPVAQGDQLAVQARSIVSVTNVTNIVVLIADSP